MKWACLPRHIYIVSTNTNLNCRPLHFPSYLAQMSHQCKRLRSGEKDIIMNVRALEKSKGRSILWNRVLKRTAKGTKIGRTSIKAITKDYRGQGQFDSPAKRYQSSRVKINPDDFDRAAIKQAIHEFYACKKYPTLDKVLIQLCDKNLFSGDRSTLAKVLKTMGFRYKLREDGKQSPIHRTISTQAWLKTSLLHAWTMPLSWSGAYTLLRCHYREVRS